MDHAWQTILGLVSILGVLVHGLMKYVIPYLIRTKTDDAEKQYGRVDSLIETFKQAISGIALHEKNALHRHGEIITRLDTKIIPTLDKIHGKPPDSPKDDTKGG